MSTVMLNDSATKKGVVMAAAKKAIYETILGKLIWESTPQEIKDKILTLVDKEFFIPSAGAVAAAIMGYDEFIEKIEALKNTAEDGREIAIPGEDATIPKDKVVDILKIGGYIKSLIDISDDELFKESDGKIGTIVESEDLVIDNTVPTNLQVAIEKKEFTNFTKDIVKLVTATLKEDMETLEDEKKEEEEFVENLEDVIKPDEEEKENSNTGATLLDDKNDSDNEEGGETSDEEDNMDYANMGEPDVLSDFPEMDEDQTSFDIEDHTESDDEEDKEKEDEDTKEEKLIKENSMAKFGNINTGLREKKMTAKRPTLRIRESVGKLYSHLSSKE